MRTLRHEAASLPHSRTVSIPPKGGGHVHNATQLVGRAGSEEAGTQLLGFTVCFEIANPAEGTGHHSVCAWSGWAMANEITTNWLLTSSILDPKDQWSSMRIGRDTFVRVFDSASSEYLDFDEQTLNRLLANARK
jgi:hypothetical protein